VQRSKNRSALRRWQRSADTPKFWQKDRVGLLYRERDKGKKTVDIELYIEELVLHGFAQADKHRIATAVQEELARLFKAQGMPTGPEQGIHREHLDGGSFNVRTGESADSIGVHIGKAVYEGIKKEKIR
jgi:hypothetical protein